MNRQEFALEASLFLMLLIAALVAVSVAGIGPVVRAPTSITGSHADLP